MDIKRLQLDILSGKFKSISYAFYFEDFEFVIVSPMKQAAYVFPRRKLFLDLSAINMELFPCILTDNMVNTVKRSMHPDNFGKLELFEPNGKLLEYKDSKAKSIKVVEIESSNGNVAYLNKHYFDLFSKGEKAVKFYGGKTAFTVVNGDNEAIGMIAGVRL